MAFIKKYYGPALLLLALLGFGVYKWYQSYQLSNYFLKPHSKDIYVFKFEDAYSPYLLDFVQADSCYFYNHTYDFLQSIPSEALILQDSFKIKIHYIYSRSELNRLFEENKIVKIYR